MYELARILQDRFSNADLTKGDKASLKSDCLDIHCNLIKNVLEIPFVREPDVDIEPIINEKNRKTSI